MSNKANIASLKQKQSRLTSHEKTLKHCLDMIKDQQRKLEIERLQLESMLDALNLDINRSRIRPDTNEFPPFSAEPDEAVNEQKLQLGLSALDQILAGTFYSKENDEEEEEEEEDEHDDDDDDDEVGGDNVDSSSENTRKKTKFDEAVIGLQSDIFDFIDQLD